MIPQGESVASSADEVRVLSLLQPWASLWVGGKKKIETRDWGTRFRGRIAVHASMGFKRETRVICEIEPFASALRDLGFSNPDTLPRGVVLGWVTLTDCQQMSVLGLPFGATFDIEPRCAHPLLTEEERAFGLYQAGRFAWLTAGSDGERHVLPEPIPMKGSLGLRRCPADVVARLVP